MDSIIACASGSLENVAISILRISGSFLRKEFQKFFSLELNSVISGKIFLSKFIIHNEHIDDVMCVFYDAPKSYTGENILELFVHGNKANRQIIIEAFLTLPNVRLAKNGEFSLRAYQNGKMNLFQVEGLGILLNAQNAIELKFGKNLLFDKSYEDQFSDLRLAYKNHRASLELSIDFSEDLEEIQQVAYRKETFFLFKENINSLFKNSIMQRNYFLPKILIYGETNAGKSTLFNLLLKKNRSIVDNEEGTTRDYIKERIEYKGIFFELIDSAGIRETTSSPEKKGIDKTNELLQESFFIIHLVHPNQKITLQDADLIIYSHEDLFPDLPNEYLRVHPNKDSIFHTIFEKVYEKYEQSIEKKSVLLDRHFYHLQEIQKKLHIYEELLEKEEDFGIILGEFQRIEKDLVELFGFMPSEEVLSQIFSSFCIGK
jgi:tRNA modification GTPase